MTLQDQYIQIKEGKGSKNHFLKQARHLFPEYVNHYNSFSETVNILKGKNILTENRAGLGMVSTGGRKDWFSLFQENVKAVEKNVSKEVLDDQSHAFDNKDVENIDNLYGQTFLNGFYTEMQDPKNKGKDVDEVKKIVAKNLGKDRNYYATNAQFGIKGIGYTKDAPGLGEPKEPKGKYKASGYGDLPEKTEKAKSNTKDTLGGKEAKTTMPKKVAEMPVKPQNSKGVKKMSMPGKPKTIRLQEVTDDNASSKTYSVYELRFGQPYRFYNEEKNKFIPDDAKQATLYTKEEAELKRRELLKPRVDYYQKTGNHYEEIHVGDLYKKNILRESRLRTIIQQLIKEELNIKEIDEVGKMAEYQAKTRKIAEEIMKRRKKLKALTTLEEIEEGATNPKTMKDLKNEIKKLEGLKSKLDKKYSPKEEVIGEEDATPISLKEGEEYAFSKQEITKKSPKTNLSILDIYNILSEIDDIDFIQETGIIIPRKYWNSRGEFTSKQKIYKEIQKHVDDKNIVNDLKDELYRQTKASSKELNEGYGMSLADAKAEAERVSEEEGVVQHVEETEKGSGKYRVSDWYDSDLTVASYENGEEL